MLFIVHHLTYEVVDLHCAVPCSNLLHLCGLGEGGHVYMENEWRPILTQALRVSCDQGGRRCSLGKKQAGSISTPGKRSTLGEHPGSTIPPCRTHEGPAWNTQCHTASTPTADPLPLPPSILPTVMNPLPYWRPDHHAERALVPSERSTCFLSTELGIRHQTRRRYVSWSPCNRQTTSIMDHALFLSSQ